MPLILPLLALLILLAQSLLVMLLIGVAHSLTPAVPTLGFGAVYALLLAYNIIRSRFYVRKANA